MVDTLFRRQKMLTPFSFMQAISGVDYPEDDYNWNTQVRIEKPTCNMATTFRATQTFDHKGNPKDNDND